MYARLFRGWNASSKVRLIYLEVLKHQKIYGWSFWKPNGNEEVTSKFWEAMKD